MSIENWLDHEFESSSGTTPEFRVFHKEWVKTLKKKLGVGYSFKDFKINHFDTSGFTINKETGKIVYISMSDVRHLSWHNEWYNKILIRSAESVKDYRGGRNMYRSFEGIRELADSLTE